MFSSFDNEFYDNFDYEIRVLSKKIKYKLLFTKYFNKMFKKVAKGTTLYMFNSNYFWKNIHKFESLYNLLEDKRSKEKYIEILAYKMLGFSKVKLSLNNKEFWKIRDETNKYKRDSRISVNFRNGYLDLYELQDLGFNIQLYFISNGIVTDFILQQYNYEDIVKVEKDDIVIDCGGCWGDTALYFASLGAREVYVYEFIPSNINILKQNLDLNPQYIDTIRLVDNPVWSTSDEKLSYYDNGPSSIVDSFDRFESKIETLSIDDLVRNRNLDKVDFIKMDIEGAEISALEGAKNTIEKYKPKLAISAYHKEDDLFKIPDLIHSIRSDYTFYFDYYTIIGDEAIVYAI